MKEDKEQVIVKDESKNEEIKEYENNKKRKSIGGIIYRILLTILVIFILFDTIMGIIGIQKVKEGKEPIWYINSKTDETKGKKEVTYNLGLYVIVNTKEGRETRTVLKPFFLK